MPKTIVVFRLPLKEGRPVPKTWHVAAGEYAAERGGRVTVSRQTCEVDGWNYDYPNMQVVLRVAVAESKGV